MDVDKIIRALSLLIAAANNKNKKLSSSELIVEAEDLMLKDYIESGHKPAR
jgi:hypothetical protein